MAPQKREVYTSNSRGWSEAREVPVMAWMEKYTVENFNNTSIRTDKAKMAPLHTSDFEYVNTDGTEYKGFDAAFEGIQQLYAPFPEIYHVEPRFWSVWESEGGIWEMVGHASFFADLPAGSGGSKPNKDANGRSWDLSLPSMFHFWYIKNDSGGDGLGAFSLKRAEVYSDTFPAIQEMMKRGLIKL